MLHQIRTAEIGDAGRISDVIVSALCVTNARGYAPEIIARLQLSFSPSAVERQIVERDVFVGNIHGRIVGTASLHGDEVRTVFVSPEAQGRGMGKALMHAVEEAARGRGIERLRLSSSITAEAFYTRLGYTAVQDRFHGDERTIVMERLLSPTVA